MACIESLKYNKTYPIFIFEYALPLIDHTLRDIVGDAAISGYKSKNKGGLEQIVEDFYYPYRPISSLEPDYIEAGIKMKTIGRRINKDMTLQIQERLVVDMINYNKVVNQIFEHC